jgi:predicted enzyme related to lactoylglutathione lyase
MSRHTRETTVVSHPDRFSTPLVSERLSRSQDSCAGKERLMNQGIRTYIVPVKDVARAKTLYSKLLDAEPHVDGGYYVGFRVGDQEIGLVPNGHTRGMTGPVGYCHVTDIRKTLALLLAAGAQIQQEVTDVGGAS